MTRTFTYTFNTFVKKEGTDGKHESDWAVKKVTLKKKVTDRMEERGLSHKAGYAANYFNEVLRKEYGYKKSVVTAWMLEEIK